MTMTIQRTASLMMCLAILLSSCTNPSVSNRPSQASENPTFQTGILFQSSSYNDPTEREIANILEENLTAVMDKNKQKFDDTFIVPKDGEIYYYVMDPPYQRFEKLMFIPYNTPNRAQVVVTYTVKEQNNGQWEVNTRNRTYTLEKNQSKMWKIVTLD